MFTPPQEILNTLPVGPDVRIAFVVYNSSVLFPVRKTSRISTNGSKTVVGSQVVSAIVNGIDNGAILDGQVTFSLILTHSPALGIDEIITRRCAFWDFSASSKNLNFHLSAYRCFTDGHGDWSTVGCSMTSFNASTNTIHCKCNHLTNFACLVVSIMQLFTLLLYLIA